MESSRDVDIEHTEELVDEVCAQGSRSEMVDELISDHMLIDTEASSYITCSSKSEKVRSFAFHAN